MDFPTLTSGVVTQYPGYSESDEFYTVAVDLDCGVSIGKSLNPGAPIRRFSISITQMTREEMLVMDAFFRTVGGTTIPFRFPDDSGAILPNCRFVSPKMTFSYTEQAQWGTSAEIRSFVPTA